MIVLDRVGCYQRSSSSKPSFTVHGYSSRFFLGSTYKLLYDIFGRTGSIGEVHFIVPDSSLFELVAIVGLVVETNDGCNSHFFEDWHVIFRCKIMNLNRKIGTPSESSGLS